MALVYVKDTESGKTAYVPSSHLKPGLFGSRLVEIDDDRDCGCSGGEAKAVSAIEAPAGNASQSAWSDFLTSQGVAHDPEAPREELKALWADTTEEDEA
jgi:hypothetical protein